MLCSTSVGHGKLTGTVCQSLKGTIYDLLVS